MITQDIFNTEKVTLNEVTFLCDRMEDMGVFKKMNINYGDVFDGLKNITVGQKRMFWAIALEKKPLDVRVHNLIDKLKQFV